MRAGSKTSPFGGACSWAHFWCSWDDATSQPVAEDSAVANTNPEMLRYLTFHEPKTTATTKGLGSFAFPDRSTSSVGDSQITTCSHAGQFRVRRLAFLPAWRQVGRLHTSPRAHVSLVAPNEAACRVVARHALPGPGPAEALSSHAPVLPPAHRVFCGSSSCGVPRTCGSEPCQPGVRRS